MRLKGRRGDGESRGGECPHLCEDFFFFELAELRHCSLQVEAGFVGYSGHIGWSGVSLRVKTCVV